MKFKEVGDIFNKLEGTSKRAVTYFVRSVRLEVQINEVLNYEI